MKILAIEKENKGITSTDFTPYLKDESLKVLELFEKGIIREIYFDQFHCAIIILECNDLLEAEAELDKLPLVINGLIKFEIHELKPYSGFSRLLI
jgi:hypothetical protein